MKIWQNSCDTGHTLILWYAPSDEAPCPLCAAEKESDRVAALLERRIAEQAATIEEYKQELGI